MLPVYHLGTIFTKCKGKNTAEHKKIARCVRPAKSTAKNIFTLSNARVYRKIELNIAVLTDSELVGQLLAFIHSARDLF